MHKVGDTFEGSVLKAHNPIRRDHDYWVVACRCQRPVSVPTPKLEKWFYNGKPIGCSSCRLKEKEIHLQKHGSPVTVMWEQTSPGSYKRLVLPELDLKKIVVREDWASGPLPGYDPEDSDTEKEDVEARSSSDSDSTPLDPEHLFQI